MRPTPTHCLGTALLALVAAGCGGGPVEIGAGPAPTADAEACAAFTAALPGTLVGLPRRETRPADAPGAAWGDPAVVVTCGVPPAAGFDRFSDCVVADGVGWYAPASASEDPGAPVTLTTVTVEPRVRLEVPGEQRPPAALLSALAPLVREHLRAVEPCV